MGAVGAASGGVLNSIGFSQSVFLGGAFGDVLFFSGFSVFGMRRLGARLAFGSS